jgi:hypothetical protein
MIMPMICEAGKEPRAALKVSSQGTPECLRIIRLQVRALPGAILKMRQLRKFHNCIQGSYRTITGHNCDKENVLNCDHLCIDQGFDPRYGRQ